MLDKIRDCFLILLMLFIVLCMLALTVFMCIELKSSYIDVQLKEKLLYSGDSCTQEVTIIG